jgi:hypothetical protein
MKLPRGFTRLYSASAQRRSIISFLGVDRRFPFHHHKAMTMNAYTEVHRERQAALRGIRPEVANAPKPSQAFSVGTHSGKEAAVSREVRDTNNPRKE